MLLEAEVKQKMSLDIYGANTYEHIGHTIINFFNMETLVTSFLFSVSEQVSVLLFSHN